jgi:tetratricopeptide (TPR) repeat protein
MVRSARRAIPLDDHLPDAYFLLGIGLNLLHGIGSSDRHEVEEEAYAALNQGLALAPENALLLWALGEAQVQFDLDYDAAETSFRRALAVDPINPNARSFHESLAMVAMRRGRVDQALDHYQRAFSLYDSDVHV